MAQKSAVTIEEIWKNLEVTDRQENQFRFSASRSRHIVVLGSKKTTNYVVGDIIRRDTYDHRYCQSKKEEQKTITYVMVQDDPSCNVCIINLIDIPPLEHFIKRLEKSSKDPSPSPMTEIDKTIDQFATNINLIILVCEENNFELMTNMKKWASNRGHIMALVFIVDPKFDTKQRENFLISIRENENFKANQLNDLFGKGIFCISDLSHKFRDTEEQKTAQNYVKEWRSKFLEVCVGCRHDRVYTISLHDEKQSKNGLCNTS